MVNPQEYIQRNRSRTPVRKHSLGYGVTRRARKKPFIVKFKQNKKTIYVGSFRNLPEAQLAAERYLRNLRNARV